jgi:gamma-glutamyltranspeptidase
MRILSILFVSVLFFSSCDLNKYTKVYIENNNPFPMNVSLKTNNVETVFRVEANSSIDTLRKFTDITFEDGEWEFQFSNAETNELIKKHNHGKFYKGELANGLTVRMQGTQFEFSVDN